MHGHLLPGQPGGHAELSDSAPEGCRSPVGKPPHMHGLRFGDQPLAYALVVILEELVEDAARGRPVHADVDHADHLHRIYDQVARLLGDEVPAVDERDVVYLAAHILAVEVQIGRSLEILAPESVEIRIFDVLETDEVHPLVELQRGGDGLAENHVGLAQVEGEVDVIRRYRPGRRSGTLLPGILTGAAVVGHHLHLRRAGTYLLSADRGMGCRKRELSRLHRLQDIGVRGLRGAGLAAVGVRIGAHRPLLRSPYELEVPACRPAEVGRRRALYHESHVELLLQAHQIGDPDVYFRLCESCQRQQERRQQGCQFSHHQFFSFCLDLSMAAFSRSTLSRVFCSLACTAFSICWACWGEIAEPLSPESPLS